MERIIVTNSADKFDKVVHEGPPEGGDLEFIVKSGACQQGGAAVCVTFTTKIADELVRVQLVTTLKILLATLPTLEAADEGNKRRN